MRMVLDSNILLVAISRRSKYRPIWDAFVEGQYTLIVSDDVTYEYEEIFEDHSAPGVSNILIELLIESPWVINQQVYYSWNAIEQDPDDNKFFDIASCQCRLSRYQRCAFQCGKTTAIPCN